MKKLRVNIFRFDEVIYSLLFTLSTPIDVSIPTEKDDLTYIDAYLKAYTLLLILVITHCHAHRFGTKICTYLYT